MKRRIVQRPQVQRDLIDHFVFIGRDNRTAAIRFLEEAERAFAKIAEMPGIGSAWDTDDSRLQNIRHRAVSRRFRNYLVFYRVLDDTIEILTVIHGARDLAKHIPGIAQDNRETG